MAIYTSRWAIKSKDVKITPIKNVSALGDIVQPGDWDIVVDDFNNVISDKNKTLWRVDNGGALRYRALN